MNTGQVSICESPNYKAEVASQLVTFLCLATTGTYVAYPMRVSVAVFLFTQSVRAPAVALSPLPWNSSRS
jgi:hypothetical protein